MINGDQVSLRLWRGCYAVISPEERHNLMVTNFMCSLFFEGAYVLEKDEELSNAF